MAKAKSLEGRYELAAIYAGDGAPDTAASIAILAAIGYSESAEARAAVQRVLPSIRTLVAQALIADAKR